MMTSINRAANWAAGGLLALVVLCCGVGIWAAWEQSNALQEQANAAALLRNHMNADMMHDAIRSDALAALQATDPSSGIAMADVQKDLADHLETLNAAIAADIAYEGSKEVDDVADQLKAPVATYSDAARSIVRAAASNPAAGRAQLDDFFKQFRVLEKSMSDASDVIEKHSNEVATAAARFGTIAIVLLTITLLIGAGATVMMGSVVRRVLVAPLIALAQVMRELSGGNLKVQVPHADRADELGDMAKAIDAFRGQLDAAEADKQAQTQLIVGTIGQGLDALATGDLTAEIHADLTGPFAVLKRNFNEAVLALRTLIGTVATGTDNIRTGAAEIAQASEDLARRTEGNAASLEETTAAVAQIDGRLKASAAAAASTVARADKAIAVVGTGRTLADEAVAAMNRVSDSAQGIDSVIEGLDKIAFQTRVLAMNAAVEAGRAGEAGRGFAVVADLVSALAMRAEEEAGRARDQLTATQTDIVTAVEAVHKVDAALVDISGDVGEVHALLGNMAVDNQAQSTAITQVSAAIGTMDQATQQNAAMVEETSAAARNLTSEVNALAESAATFKTGREHTRAHRSAPPAWQTDFARAPSLMAH